MLRQIENTKGEIRADFEITSLTNEFAKGLMGGYGTNTTCWNNGCDAGTNKTCTNPDCGGNIQNNGCTNSSCS